MSKSGWSTWVLTMADGTTQEFESPVSIRISDAGAIEINSNQGDIFTEVTYLPGEVRKVSRSTDFSDEAEARWYV